MKSRIGLSLCVALVTAAATIMMNAEQARAQSYGNGYSSQTQAPQKKKVGLLYRLFSRDKSRSTPAQPAPSQPPANAQTGRRPTVQELLEAKFRAEGREVPPLTLEQLAAEQGMSEPEFTVTPHAQQPNQNQYSMPQQTQPTYAAGHQNYAQPQAPAAASAPQNVAQPTPTKKRSGFRAFLSRLNPFHRGHHEEENPATVPQQFQATPGQFPNQQQYAQQPRDVYQPPQALPHQQQLPPRVVAAPPTYQRPGTAQPSQGVPTITSRPFPGVPNVAARQNTEDDDMDDDLDDEDDDDFAFDEEVPMLADNPPAEELPAPQQNSDPFADEPLPQLTDATNDGFHPTKQPEFQEPIVKVEELPVLEETEIVEETPAAEEPLVAEQTPAAEEPAATEEVQVAEDESQSPYSGLTLDGEDEEPALPKLQPVPQRNNYINMDQLNAQVDSESLRREKRRLLLLSRPELTGLKGFCPVTLKNDRDLVDAKPEYQSEFESKVYQLSSAEAKEEFERSPQDYAPAKGGIDMVKYTLGAGEVEGTLEFAAWYRGRLYLFSSAVTYDAFMQHPSKFADKLDAEAAEGR